MIVIHLIRGLPSATPTTGVSKVIHNLAFYTSKRGISVEVWGLTEKETTIKVNDHCTYRGMPLPKLKVRVNRFITKHIETLPEKVIFHIHSVFIPEYVGIIKKLHQQNFNWVLTPHSGYNPISMRKNAWLKKLYMLLFESFIIKNSKALHAIGEDEFQHLKQKYPEQKVVLIPNGQETQLPEFPRTEPEHHFIIGYCGRLAIRQKGLDLLFQAFSKIYQHLESAYLWLIGDGVDREELEKLAVQLGIGDRVRFLGAHYNDEKFRLLCQLDLFVHTSRWEALPTAVLEASALGIPVLISEATNLGDYVSEFRSGEILHENTPDEIANKIMEINKLPKEEQDQLGANAKRLINEKLNWDIVVSRLIEEVYKPTINIS